MASVNVYTYELPLHPYLSIPSSQRKGIVLESIEHQAIAEASPLPGYSKESFEEALEEIFFCLPLLSTLSSEALIDDFLAATPLSSSVAFAIYSFCHQLITPIHYPHIIPMRHYVDIPYQVEDVRSKLLQALSFYPPHEPIKLKLSSYPAPIAKALVQEILQRFSIQLHVDIGAMWSLEEASVFSDAFPKGSLLNIEDPVATLKDLKIFVQRSPHPVSVDRLLRKEPIKEFIELPQLVGMEFKPTLDMQTLLNKPLLETLRKSNVDYTLSSSYETAIGIACIGALGKQLNAFPCYGVDTLHVFKHSLVHKAPYKEGNLYTFQTPLTLNHSLLHATKTLSYR